MAETLVFLTSKYLEDHKIPEHLPFRLPLFALSPRESVESLIQKHSYARSPIRTYGEEDVLGDEVQTAQSRGEVLPRGSCWEPSAQRPRERGGCRMRP